MGEDRQEVIERHREKVKWAYRFQGYYKIDANYRFWQVMIIHFMLTVAPWEEHNQEVIEIEENEISLYIERL